MSTTALQLRTINKAIVISITEHFSTHMKKQVLIAVLFIYPAGQIAYWTLALWYSGGGSIGSMKQDLTDAV